MDRLRENIDYSDITVCDTCHSQVTYHVTDIKGVEERYLICPHCHHKILLK